MLRGERLGSGSGHLSFAISENETADTVFPAGRAHTAPSRFFGVAKRILVCRACAETSGTMLEARLSNPEAGQGQTQRVFFESLRPRSALPWPSTTSRKHREP